MCETCLTKLHANKGFTGRVPKPEEIIALDADKNGRVALENLYHELRVSWDRYFSVMAAEASAHEPKERGTNKPSAPVEEESEPEEAA